jgi:transcriptional regulator with XRE-family HTH domain
MSASGDGEPELLVETREEKTLGSLIRAIRREKDWTLKQMSEVVGIPLSTLGKVESDQLSLTYDKMQMVTRRLGMSMADFLGYPGATERSQPATSRRSLTGPANSVNVETDHYRFDYLCADLADKRMIPIITEVKARSREEFGAMVSYPGEQFVFVLEGEVRVMLEFYTPTVLAQGQGMYIDGDMRHSYILGDCDRAVMLTVRSGDGSDIEAGLADLASLGHEAKR